MSPPQIKRKDQTMSRRRHRRNKWAGIIITILIPATPTILEPIAPGCDTYGPTCVIDLTGTWPAEQPTVETTDPEPPVGLDPTPAP